MSPLTDPVALAQRLIRCRSITPEDDGAIAVVADALTSLGFTCHRLTFAEKGTAPVDNLYARLGEDAPNLAFAGHTDVVPPGDPAAWRVDPFAGEVIDGMLYGRGAADMKGGIACFVAAIAQALEQRSPAGSISLLITGDEEGPAINGMPKLLGWLAEEGERLDACILGEPTNPRRIGEMIKIGRRGSLVGQLRVKGIQGHTAYHEQADNPIPKLLALLGQLIGEPLDGGNDRFEPSRLEITSVDVGNPASNVIPGEARATFNVRFNDQHTANSLEAELRRRLDATRMPHRLEITSASEAFHTLPGPLTELLESVVERELGIVPELSTSGGTSDARFIKEACPVVEFGLVSATIHQVDERVSVKDLYSLTKVYRSLLEQYFAHAHA